jgi:hypothetical protein
MQPIAEAHNAQKELMNAQGYGRGECPFLLRQDRGRIARARLEGIEKVNGPGLADLPRTEGGLIPRSLR